MANDSLTDEFNAIRVELEMYSPANNLLNNNSVYVSQAFSRLLINMNPSKKASEPCEIDEGYMVCCCPPKSEGFPIVAACRLLCGARNGNAAPYYSKAKIVRPRTVINNAYASTETTLCGITVWQGQTELTRGVLSGGSILSMPCTRADYAIDYELGLIEFAGHAVAGRKGVLDSTFTISYSYAVTE